jgi:hypothetical protein
VGLHVMREAIIMAKGVFTDICAAPELCLSSHFA